MITDGIYYMTALLATKGVGFFLIPVYTRVLSQSHYGILELFNTTVNVATIILGFGLPQIIAFRYRRYDNHERRNKILGIIGIFFYLCLPTYVLVWLLYLVQYLHGWHLFEFDLFLLGSLLVVLNYFFSTYRSLLIQSQRAKLLATLQFLMAVVLVSLNIYFVVYLRIAYIGIILAQVISIFLFLCTAQFVYSFNFSCEWKKLFIPWNEAKKTLKIGFPLILTALCAWIMTGLDRFFLAYFWTADLVGIYSLAVKFPMIYQTIVLATISAVYSPYIYRKYKLEGVAPTERNNRKVVGLVTAGTLILPIVGYYAFWPLFRIFVGKAFFDSYSYIFPLLAGTILLGAAQMLSYFHYYREKTRYIFIGYLLAAGVNAILNYLLIPIYSIWGAVLSTIFGYLTLSVFFLLSGEYFLKKEPEPSKVQA
jgi:O-antigen/teichoic acid export membrane protein